MYIIIKYNFIFFFILSLLFSYFMSCTKRFHNIPHACQIKSVFDSVVVGAFQITFRAKMHANDIFLFFKNHF
jgi:hypothetical protein